MKALLSLLLTATLLAGLAPGLTAQRVVASSYSAYTSGGHGRGGYASSRVWVPGRYETVYQRVWIPGCTERVWAEPVFALRYDSCGNRLRVLVSAGHWRSVHHPGHYEERATQVYRPGRWVARGSHCD